MGHWMPDGTWHETAADNLLRPFHFGAVRGRMVRLGAVLDEILSRHDYPEPVAQILGEVMILGCCLASSLKLDGIFTIQLRGTGPISLLVADMATGEALGEAAEFKDQPMALRGYAQFSAAEVREDQQSWRELLGDGTLSFTVDQFDSGERYQGIVELVGESLASSAAHYFSQSEQLGTAITLACQRTGSRDQTGWRGGAILLQQIAADGGQASFAAPSDDQPMTSPNPEEEEDWHRAKILLDSCTPNELLDQELGADALLFRLFHLELVKVHPMRRVIARCRCSEQRISNLIQGFSPADRAEFSENCVISVKCEFCNRLYSIPTETGSE
ncbi:MAG: Hsp33 family molecular chaperone HslO [Alphaproteobacteria bacterium]|nr:Hsp33 family molecular chaperone HslO [Alphaproteobacteria bacterium]